MHSITLRVIDPANERDIRIPNHPFVLFGRLIPRYDGCRWSSTEELFLEKTQMCFPDEGYRMEAMPDCIFLGAYAGETCVGLAVLQKSWNKYLYIYDLKVNEVLRGQGIGTMLVQRAESIAADLGYRGVWVVAQDNNLAACRFYLKNGFVLGGLDTQVYRGTAQEGKADVHFYKEIGAAT